MSTAEVTLGLTSKFAQELVAKVPSWYHHFEVVPGVWTPGANPCITIIETLGLKDDLSGLRVLDVGTRDGFYAFECERRGAQEVVAIDIQDPSLVGFNTVKKLRNAKTLYVQRNLLECTSQEFGKFELVLMLGVLYHMKHPLLALGWLRDLCRFDAQLCIESYVLPDHSDIPMARFFPGDELNNDPTNWWGFNVACLHAMLKVSGFAVYSTSRNGNRAVVLAHKV